MPVWSSASILAVGPQLTDSHTFRWIFTGRRRQVGRTRALSARTGSSLTSADRGFDQTTCVTNVRGRHCSTKHELNDFIELLRRPVEFAVESAHPRSRWRWPLLIGGRLAAAPWMQRLQFPGGALLQRDLDRGERRLSGQFPRPWANCAPSGERGFRRRADGHRSWPAEESRTTPISLSCVWNRGSPKRSSNAPSLRAGSSASKACSTPEQVEFGDAPGSGFRITQADARQ